MGESKKKSGKKILKKIIIKNWGNICIKDKE